MGGEGQYACLPRHAANVARGTLVMAVWGLKVGVCPTRAVEDAVADIIRAHPAWHRTFVEGTPTEAGEVVREACEVWARRDAA